MKNKTIKILSIISGIILLMGIICWFGTNPLLDETDTIISLFSVFATIAVRTLIILLTGGIIASIWLIYGIIILFKKIKNNNVKFKNIIVIVILIIIIIRVVITISSLMNTWMR